jgi:UTP:GlnB (protein PII) uridylyltransferase
MASSDGSEVRPLEIDINNDIDPDYTVISVEGKGQGSLLAALSSSLQQYGINVNSATMRNEEGIVVNEFKVGLTPAIINA